MDVGIFRNMLFLKTVTTFTLGMEKWWNLKQALVPHPPCSLALDKDAPLSLLN